MNTPTETIALLLFAVAVVSLILGFYSGMAVAAWLQVAQETTAVEPIDPRQKLEALYLKSADIDKK